MSRDERYHIYELFWFPSDPDFYSNEQNFTQILCKISAAEASGCSRSFPLGQQIPRCRFGTFELNSSLSQLTKCFACYIRKLTPPTVRGKMD